MVRQRPSAVCRPISSYPAPSPHRVRPTAATSSFPSLPTFLPTYLSEKVVQVKLSNLDGGAAAIQHAPAFDLVPNACQVETEDAAVSAVGQGEASAGLRGSGGGGGGLYISDLFTASHIDYLLEKGVTHVLNCATEVQSNHAAAAGLCVLDLPIKDRSAENIEVHWAAGGLEGNIFLTSTTNIPNQLTA